MFKYDTTTVESFLTDLICTQVDKLEQRARGETDTDTPAEVLELRRFMALSKEERARDQNNFFFVEKLAKKAEKPVRKEEKPSRKAAKVVSSMFGSEESKVIVVSHEADAVPTPRTATQTASDDATDTPQLVINLCDLPTPAKRVAPANDVAVEIPKLVINLTDLPRKRDQRNVAALTDIPNLVINLSDLPTKRVERNIVAPTMPKLVIDMTDLPTPAKPAYELNDGFPTLIIDLAALPFPRSRQHNEQTITEIIARAESDLAEATKNEKDRHRQRAEHLKKMEDRGFYVMRHGPASWLRHEPITKRVETEYDPSASGYETEESCAYDSDSDAKDSDEDERYIRAANEFEQEFERRFDLAKAIVTDAFDRAHKQCDLAAARVAAKVVVTEATEKAFSKVQEEIEEEQEYVKPQCEPTEVVDERESWVIKALEPILTPELMTALEQIHHVEAYKGHLLPNGYTDPHFADEGKKEITVLEQIERMTKLYLDRGEDHDRLDLGYCLNFQDTVFKLKAKVEHDRSMQIAFKSRQEDHDDDEVAELMDPYKPYIIDRFTRWAIEHLQQEIFRSTRSADNKAIADRFALPIAARCIAAPEFINHNICNIFYCLKRDYGTPYTCGAKDELIDVDFTFVDALDMLP